MLMVYLVYYIKFESNANNFGKNGSKSTISEDGTGNSNHVGMLKIGWRHVAGYASCSLAQRQYRAFRIVS